jgi:Acyltransferase family
MAKNMELTKERTNIAKGAAICFMFANHLYSFPDRLLNGNYFTPLTPLLDLELSVGNFGGICVSMFMFLSGYGMFLGSIRSDRNPWKYSLKKIRDFYFTYWIYFLISVPIGLIFFKNETIWNSPDLRYSTDILTLLSGFLGWSARYNSEWWFVRMFVLVLLLLSPLYLSLGRQKPTLMMAISIGLLAIAWTLKLDHVGMFGFVFWQISFAVGILCARSQFFMSAFIRYFADFKIIWLCLGIFLFGMFRFRVGAKIDFLVIPIFIYLVVRIIEMLGLTQIFSTIGRYSFPMWLTHSFFCYYYFQDFIYFFRWSPSMFVLLIIASMLLAIVVENLRFQIQDRFPSHLKMARK